MREEQVSARNVCGCCRVSGTYFLRSVFPFRALFHVLRQKFIYSPVEYRWVGFGEEEKKKCMHTLSQSPAQTHEAKARATTSKTNKYLNETEQLARRTGLWKENKQMLLRLEIIWK